MSGKVQISPIYLTISALREFPTELVRRDIEPHISEHVRWAWSLGAPLGWHESILRSYQVLQKVKRLLEIGTPAEVVLEIISECGE